MRSLEGPLSDAELRDMIQTADPDDSGMFQYEGKQIPRNSTRTGSIAIAKYNYISVCF